MAITTGLVVGGLSLASGIASSIFGHKEKKQQAAAQRKSLEAQARMYAQQGDMYRRSARMQANVAGLSIQAGKDNAAMIRGSAYGLQFETDTSISTINKERQQKIGQGRAEFAEAGILVDSGAAGQWERDEIADAIIEKAQVLRTCSDQGMSVELQAKQATAEGYSSAANGYASAASTAMQAWGSYMNSILTSQGIAAAQGPSGGSLAAGIAIATLGAGAQGVSAYAAAGGTWGSKPGGGGGN